jgi:uncharacterized repeat protein (TIGR03803 family)
VKDKLYGMTRDDGKYGRGTVFSINPLGNVNYTVIHNFAGQPNDGWQARANLLDVDGTLYGVTGRGGEYDGGIVFKLKP